MEEQGNHPIRALLKVRWTIFVFHYLTVWRFSVHLCVAEFVCLRAIELNHSIKRTLGDVTLWKFHEHSQYYFLHCYTTSFLMVFNDCCHGFFEHKMAKISFIQSVVWCQHHHSAFRQCQNRCCTCQLPRHPQDGGHKRSTSGALRLATTFKCNSVAHTRWGNDNLAGVPCQSN